jgi:hypothetical protein
MKWFPVLAVFLAGVLVAAAQTPVPIVAPVPPTSPGPPAAASPRGITTLVLGADMANGIIAPGREAHGPRNASQFWDDAGRLALSLDHRRPRL